MHSCIICRCFCTDQEAEKLVGEFFSALSPQMIEEDFCASYPRNMVWRLATTEREALRMRFVRGSLGNVMSEPSQTKLEILNASSNP